MLEESGKFRFYSVERIRVFNRANDTYIVVGKDKIMKLILSSKRLEVSSAYIPNNMGERNYINQKYTFYPYPSRRKKEGWIITCIESGKEWDFQSKDSIVVAGKEQILFEVNWKKSISLLNYSVGKKWTYSYLKNWIATSRNVIEIESDQNSIFLSLGSDRNPQGCPPDKIQLNGAIASINLENGSENWYYEFFHSIQDFFVYKNIVYVAHRNEIAALNAKTGELIREISAGENYGNNIVWCDGNYAYLFNYGDEKAYLFDLELKQKLGELAFPDNFILNNQHHPYLIEDEIYIPVCPKRLNMLHASQGIVRIKKDRILQNDPIEYINEPAFTSTLIDNADGTQSYTLRVKGDCADSVIRIGEVELRKLFADFGHHWYQDDLNLNKKFNGIVCAELEVAKSDSERFNELFDTLQKRMEDWLDFMRATDNTGKLPAKVNYSVKTF
ncbi:hypothetical protein [Catenovulum sediminis]|uniref:Uncharacterized protein n=1 Tax=Catenovulum sediminis TaxID=1740262 RepID=A0ABV1RH43_9ALTE|nr:hypothetical protein [Catenovulum sediminis]